MKVPKIHLPPAIRERRFAIYWFGLLLYAAGSQMQTTALLWHLRTLSDQPAVVSGIGLVRFFPILLLAPFGGVFADAFNRRKIMFLTQSILAGVAFTLGLLTWLGIIKIWQIYLLSGIQAAALAFDLPARQSITPNLVGRDLYPSAFSMQSIALNIGLIIGPGLGGLVIAYLGQQAAYWINMGSYAAMLLTVAAIGTIPQQIQPLSGGLRASLLSIGEGIQFIRRQPIILSSMLLDFAATFFSSASTLLPFVARDILHANEVVYGWLASAEAVGAVSVGLFLSQRHKLRRQGVLLLIAVTIYGLATVLLGLSFSTVTAFAALVLVGAGDSLSTILRNTIRQLQTPDALRGRMVGINQIFFQGGPQLGEIESGLVAQAFGIPAAIISGGIGCILIVGMVALRWPQLRRYSGEESVQA